MSAAGAGQAGGDLSEGVGPCEAADGEEAALSTRITRARR